MALILFEGLPTGPLFTLQVRFNNNHEKKLGTGAGLVSKNAKSMPGLKTKAVAKSA